MINTKDNIWVEGFESETIKNNYFKNLLHNIIVYEGKTSDIPEDIAKKCVYKSPSQGQMLYYAINYGFYLTAKDVIQSALTKPGGTIYDYCIIFKK